jgi:hypothetical protein
LLGTLVDDDFEVASGIRATLRQLINGYNFGVVQVVPTGGTPVLIPAVVALGETSTWGARISLPI